MENGMNTARGTIISLAIVMGGWACSAQQTKVPFERIKQEALLTARLSPTDSEAANGLAYSDSTSTNMTPAATGSEPSASGFVRATPVATAPPRILDAKYIFINGLHLGMAVFDVEVTQHCIADHHCQEGNPLMPSSQAGALGVSFAFVGYGSFASYWMKKHKSSYWWLSPVVGAGTHGVGVASGFVNR